MQATIAAETAGLARTLSGRTVRIELPSDAPTYEGQLIVFMLVNQLVRLGEFAPGLQVVLPAVEKHPLLRLLPGGELSRALAEYFAVFPDSDRLRLLPEVPPSQMDVTVRVSPTPSSDVLNVWGQGWAAYLDAAPARLHPRGAPNPVGPCVASALAAAEVLKRLIKGRPLRTGLKLVPAGSLTFSAFDYVLNDGANPAIPENINVDGTVIVGVGGIGVGLVAAMTSVNALSGELLLVDRDELDVTNHNRHLATRPGDIGYKVDLAARALAFHDAVKPIRLWFDEFVLKDGDVHPLVVVGVDSDRVRREIQNTLPGVILNGGTSHDASLRVTRHTFLGGACLGCISRDDLRDHPVERQLSRQLGLDLEVVLGYIQSGEPVPADALRSGGVLTEAQIEILAGQPLPVIQLRVCSELQLSGGVDQPAVSISFLSAMPGFLLLGEMIKERHFTDERPPLNDSVNHAFLSMLGRPHPAFLRGQMQKRPDCDCTRVPFVNAYRHKSGRR